MRTVKLIFNEFPWAKHLPPDDRTEFEDGVANAVQASADLDDWSILAQHIYGWQATAEVYADPVLFRALAKPHRGDGGAIRAAWATTRWMVTTCGGRRLRLGSILGRRSHERP